MRLKCVVLDGFKSYAHRQEIGDLDPHFNAITGLNGSGKSNIFDALCFVMGISNLKRVRAEDTRDLIFKSGNAGIQKASVTIEFLNDDPFNHPPGYTPTEFPIIRISRQVQVGGKQKFFLNDRVSDQAKVKTFFHNALLNVDNAHFMVLQGTVHKMIGMKSSEILGLLEEASGTRVFDTRRRTAENLLRSKEKRVESINETISEITPRVLAMKQQQEEYGKFVQAKEGLAERSKFQTAFNYWSNSKSADEKRKKAANQHANIDVRRQQVAEIPRQREAAKGRLAAATEASHEPSEAIERLHAMESEQKKEAAKTKAQTEAADKAIKAFEKELRRITVDKEQNVRRLDKFQTDTGKIRDDHVEHERLRKVVKENIEGIKESIRLAQAGVQAGLNGQSAQQELTSNKSRLIAIAGEQSRLTENLTRLKAERAKLQKEAANDEKGVQAAHAALQKAQEAMKKAEEDFEPHKAAVEKCHSLKQALQEARANYAHASQQALANSHVGQPLQYTPIPGVNAEAALHGRVAELITASEDKYTKALTVGAGVNNINKMVIENDAIAQQIIERGNLRTRVNFLPLNRVEAGRAISDEQMRIARDMASDVGGFVELATSVVTCDPMYRTIAQLTFGNFVICSDLQLATRLANDSQTRMKAVTMDGDMADPMGLVAGGSTKNLRDWMGEYAAAARSKAPLKKLEADLRAMHNELSELERAAAAAKPLQDALHRAEQTLSEVTINHKALASTSATGRLARAEEGIAGCEANMATFVRDKALLEERVRDLEELMKADPRKNVEAFNARLKAEEKRLSDLTRLLEDGSSAFELLEQEKVELEQKSMDIAHEMSVKEQEITEKKAEREALAAAMVRLVEKQQQTSALLKEASEKAQGLLREQEEAREELKGLEAQEDLCLKEIKDGEATAKILRREADAEQNRADHIARDHPWISRESATFGDVNGPYFFDDEPRTAAALEEVEKLKALLLQSERTVNEKASMLYEEYQKDLDTLVQQRSTLLTDREIILESITAVEKRKWGALDKMFHTVSDYFGKLFSMCLPGASARLVEERCAEAQRLTGLQVKVTFNGKEKESLTELSGGQRSLLALTLILAILRVRPAPVYILDEVDAALDPSHTQNIGQMLQTHFPTSQFLLVSLKDGMFNNANVLYEIRNTQGYSEVTRRAARRK